MSTAEAPTDLPYATQTVLPFRHVMSRIRRTAERLGTDRQRMESATGDALQHIGSLQHISTQELYLDELDERRFVQMLTIERQGHTHAMRRTTAAAGTPPSARRTMLLCHGITQDPAVGGAKQLHDAIAAADPTIDLVSFHTDGVGEHETKLSPVKALRRSFDAMGRARLDIGQALFDEEPLTLAGFSMGAVTVSRMAGQNIDRPRLNVTAAVLDRPALVTPDKARRVFVGQFFPYFYNNSFSKAEHRREIQAAKCATALGRLPFACLANAVHLFGGTKEELLDRAADTMPLRIIYGEQDPLAQTDLYTQLAQRHPGNVEVISLPNEGHFIGDYATEARLMAA